MILVLALLFGGFLGVWWIDLFRETPASQYHLKGRFGPVIDWPVTPIHMAALPDGRVMTYGTDLRGRQGAQFHYDVWDPRKGTTWASHMTMPNSVGTDIFCSAQVIVPSEDALLLVGGDRTVNGERNWSSPDINFFDYKGNALRSAGRTMASPRWYPSVTTLADGEVVVAGGRLDPTHYAPVPEVYTPGAGWRSLAGAASDDAFGEKNWDYPRMWQLPDGKLFVLAVDGSAFRMDPAGNGHIERLDFSITRGHPYLPSVMYRPGQILALRWFGKTYHLDINGPQPHIKSDASPGLARFNASLTVMADGNVFLNGGSLLNNGRLWYLAPNFESKIWHPDTGKWTSAAIAKRMRMYHSAAILLADGTILTGGGGAPGPEENLNAEIYYPPYLFKNDGSGDMAPRPSWLAVPGYLSWGKKFEVTASTDQIRRISLVHIGSATHTVGFDQTFLLPRFRHLGGGRFEVDAPANGIEAPPGYYYLFAFDDHGVPTVAQQVKLGN